MTEPTAVRVPPAVLEFAELQATAAAARLEAARAILDEISALPYTAGVPSLRVPAVIQRAPVLIVVETMVTTYAVAAQREAANLATIKGM